MAVTPEGMRYVAVAFSPDGKQLGLAAAGHEAIDVVPADGSAAPRRVVQAERSGYRFVWDSEGRSLLHRVGSTKLVRTWMDGRSEVLATGTRVGFPAVGSSGDVVVSADGRLVAVRLHTGMLQALSQEHGRHRGLLTVRAADAELVAGWDGEHIFVLDPTKGTRRELFSGPMFFDVELSRDGSLALVHESRGAEGHLWVASANGTYRLDLGIGWMGRLSPDGKMVVFVLQTNDGTRFLTSDLYVRSVDGKHEVRLTNTPSVLETFPVFSPDGTRLAFVDAATGRVYVAPFFRDPAKGNRPGLRVVPRVPLGVVEAQGSGTTSGSGHVPPLSREEAP